MPCPNEILTHILYISSHAHDLATIRAPKTYTPSYIWMYAHSAEATSDIFNMLRAFTRMNDDIKEKLNYRSGEHKKSEENLL